MSDVVVTQEDKQAVVDYYVETGFIADKVKLEIAFAAHRIAARKQALEEAAKVADKYSEEWPEDWGCNWVAQTASAIRKLGETK